MGQFYGRHAGQRAVGTLAVDLVLVEIIFLFIYSGRTSWPAAGLYLVDESDDWTNS